MIYLVSAALALWVAEPLALRPTAPSVNMRAATPIALEGSRKVVVTGVGVTCALGSKDEFWESLLAGKSGIDQISAFDASKFPTTIGAEVRKLPV